MQPTDTAYAYCDLKGASEGILAVMCMTGGRPSTGLVQQVTSNIIPKDQRAGFLIAAHRMIEEILLPAMPQVFKGSKLSDFKISDSGMSIVNAHNDISFEAKDNDSGDTYQAYVETLEVTIVNEEIQMNVVTKTEVSPGVRAMCHTQNALGLGLVKKKSGKVGEQTLNFKKIRQSVNHWLDKDPAIAITEIILSAVAVVLVIIAAILTDGAALLVVAAILAVASGAMMITMGIIGLVDTDDAPAIGSFLFNATAPIKWDDAKDFRLTTAGLNGSLQFGGDPGFADG